MDQVAPALLSKAAVRAEIDATEANIGRLASQLQKERRSLARLWFMIAPVGTLPTELLTKIFGLSIQAAQGQARARSVRARTQRSPRTALQQVFCLSHICSLWRDMVITFPSLWALCTIDTWLGINQKPAYLDGLQLLLDRSANLPISVSLTTSCSPWETFTLDDLAILPVIMPTAVRWKNLAIDAESVHHLMSLNVSPPGTFAGLESLQILGSRSDNAFGSFGMLPTTLDVFTSSSRLFRLTLRDLHDAWTPFRMPWTQLTHLELTSAPLAASLSILQQCPNLVSASLITNRDSLDSLDESWLFELEHLTTLPCLETLSFDVMVGCKIGPFFTTLSTPTLQTLTLSFPGPEHSQPWPASRFSVFQSRAPNITHISLSECPLRSPDLIHLLRLTPALTKLSLLRMPLCLDSWFLQAFSFDGVTTKRLVPQLCELDWRGSIENLEPAALIAAIRSRCSATLSGTAGDVRPEVVVWSASSGGRTGRRRRESR
ncbi:hypothetical protein C8R46DRAFT_1363345 [Mycena filopes]|nr:hypothetical protein C8R46DRAFT_1363345 [Mycena filopes]